MAATRGRIRVPGFAPLHPGYSDFDTFSDIEAE